MAIFLTTAVVTLIIWFIRKTQQEEHELQRKSDREEYEKQRKQQEIRHLLELQDLDYRHSLLWSLQEKAGPVRLDTILTNYEINFITQQQTLHADFYYGILHRIEEAKEKRS